jgi:hypothetical protein
MNDDFHIPTDAEWAEIIAEALAEEWEQHVQSMFDMLAGAE